MATQATLRYIVWDIIRTIREDHPDSKVTVAQAAYWVIVHADRLRKLHIGQASSGAFLATFLDVAVPVEATTGRNYFVLPQAIYDFPGDKGIHYISYEAAIDLNDPTFTSVQFSRTTAARSRRLYMNPDERPTPSRPYFYRVGANVYLLGCEQIDLLKVEIALFTTLLPVDSTLDLDEVFDFPSELIPQLKAEVIAMGLFVVKIPKEYSAEVKENAIQVLTSKDIMK